MGRDPMEQARHGAFDQNPRWSTKERVVSRTSPYKSNISIDVRMTGFSFLEKYQKELSTRAYKGALKNAATHASRIVERAIKALTPVKHGVLLRSINTRVRTYSKSWTTVTITGAGTKYVETIDGKRRRPAHYVHLLEKGHRIVRGGKLERVVIGRNGKEYVYPAEGSPRTLGFVKGTHFVERAFRSTAENALAIMRDRALANCMKAAERARKKAQQSADKATA